MTSKTKAILLARRMAELAERATRNREFALAARIENAGIEYVTAARSGDPKVEPPRWLAAMLNETVEAR